MTKCCEYCNIEIDGSYGSGRFCNKLCSCRFNGRKGGYAVQEKLKKEHLGIYALTKEQHIENGKKAAITNRKNNTCMFFDLQTFYIRILKKGPAFY